MIRSWVKRNMILCISQAFVTNTLDKSTYKKRNFILAQVNLWFVSQSWFGLGPGRTLWQGAFGRACCLLWAGRSKTRQ